MEAQTTRKLRFGAKSIAAFIEMDDVAKVNRLLRQNLVPGAFKMGRQFVLDETVANEMIRERAKAGVAA